MIEGVVFIGAVIIAITQAIKMLVPQVNGAVTIGVSALVGVLVALVDQQIGVTDLSIAAGLMAGLSASGVVTVAKSISTTHVSDNSHY